MLKNELKLVSGCNSFPLKANFGLFEVYFEGNPALP